MLKMEKHDKTELSKPKVQERRGELKENEERVLENVQGVVDWLDRYREELYGLEKNTTNKNAELAGYFSDFDEEFSKFERPAEESEIVNEARKSEIVFLGDYHNLRKSQEVSAEIFTEIASSSPNQPVLVVEFVASKDQKILDDFLAGQMEEEVFLKKVHFLGWDNTEHWPGYQKLLGAAKKFSAKVYGIRPAGKKQFRNQKEKDDSWAASLADIAQKNPKSRLFVHVGDVHLASAHLPGSLSEVDLLKNKRSVRVFQNLPQIYFSALRKYQDFQIPRALKVKNGVYNIFTAPIITKVVSDIENLEFLERETELEVWSDGLGREVVKRLCRILGIKEPAEGEEDPGYIPESSVAGFPVFYFGKESNSLEKRLSEKSLATLKEKGCVYDFSQNAVLIRRFRLKRVVEELAKFAVGPKGEKGDISALQYFCSKLFVPERRPENTTEQRGEKIFVDFLNGKQPTFPR